MILKAYKIKNFPYYTFENIKMKIIQKSAQVPFFRKRSIGSRIR